ncbi:MAG: hydrogenase maturation nickel metallochaperone HypA [Acidobacteriaceae bacterium]|jgi:hydrogenase nickel incorporation protein HypA/HybF
MHELSIAISMIDQITEESESRGGLDVEAVHMKLGIFSGVDKEALLFAYELACEGSPLQGSRLVIESIPLVIYCDACQKDRTPPSVYELSCPECGTPGQRIVTGREIEVASLEVVA